MKPTNKQEELVYIGSKIPFSLRQELREFALRKRRNIQIVVEDAIRTYLWKRTK